MIFKISVLTCLLFGLTYPLSFWLHRQDPLKQNFHKFHLGLPNFTSGLGVVLLLFVPEVSLPVKLAAVFWKAWMFWVSHAYWKRGAPPVWVLTWPCLLGMGIFVVIQHEWLSLGLIAGILSLWGACVLSLSFFAMNLGHWYLNVPGLPLAHLMRATNALGIFLGVRLLWDAASLVAQKLIYRGDSLALYQFMAQSEGFLLFVPLFFGTILPFGLIYFVRETIKVKSTQSATGLLYIIVICVLMGDLAYKYFLIQLGIIL